MLAAERKVCPHKSFKFEWSLELDKAGYCLRYWAESSLFGYEEQQHQPHSSRQMLQESRIEG